MNTDKKLNAFLDRELGLKPNKPSIPSQKFCKILMIVTIVFNIIVPFVVTFVFVMPIINKQREAEEARIYSSDVLAIEVTNKVNTSNSEYYGGNYYAYVCSFDIKVTNNGTKDITYFHGKLTIKNVDNQQLMSTTVDSGGNLASGADKTLTVNVYLPNTNTSAELWDTDYEDLNIYFCTDQIIFENSKDKYYDNEDVLIKQAISAGYLFQLLDDESAYAITRYNGNATEITLPQTYKGLPVVEIGQRAFEHCMDLTSITIPDSVTTIGWYAFFYCRRLTSITIPNSVTTIGRSAFFSCENLTSVTIPDSVTSISDSAFSGCLSLTSITIPNGVMTIGPSAFSSCENLTSITIPDSVIDIGWFAFQNCTNLTTIYCEVSSQPNGWVSGWNYGCDAKLVWGYTK